MMWPFIWASIALGVGNLIVSLMIIRWCQQLTQILRRIRGW